MRDGKLIDWVEDRSMISIYKVEIELDIVQDLMMIKAERRRPEFKF